MFKFCLNYVKKYKVSFYFYFSFVLITGILTIFIPMMTGNIIDFISQKSEKRLMYAIVAFSIVQLCLIIFNFIKNRIYIKLQTNIAFKMISDIIHHMQNVEIDVIEKYNMGYLNQRINSDSNSLSVFIISLFSDILVNSISLVFSIWVLFTMSSLLGSIMVIVGCIYITIYMLLKKKVFLVSYRLKEEQADFFSSMLMQLNDIKFIKIHSLIKSYQKKMKKAYEHYLKQVLKSQNLFFIYGSLDSIITLLANISIFIFGGRLVIDDALSIGHFTMVISYFNYIINSFKYFSSLGKNYQENKVAYNRIMDLLKIKMEQRGNVVLQHINSIRCEKLTLKRDKQIVFKDFTYEFRINTVYCICGLNGAGKSTLIDALIGLYTEKYTGKILYNSIDLKEIDTEIMRCKNISFMEQNITFIRGGVLENILISDDYCMQNISSIVSEEKIMSFLNSLGKINERKEGVSGGEGQKIGICRTFAKDADVFILDEPTTSLDDKSIERFMKQIMKLKSGKIIIIVSHDQKVIQCCDEIIRL